VVGRIYARLYEADWRRRRAQLLKQAPTDEYFEEHIASLLPQSFGSRTVVVDVSGNRRRILRGQSRTSSTLPHADLLRLVGRLLGQRNRCVIP
jgi:hypothetical protein